MFGFRQILVKYLAAVANEHFGWSFVKLELEAEF